METAVVFVGEALDSNHLIEPSWDGNLDRNETLEWRRQTSNRTILGWKLTFGGIRERHLHPSNRTILGWKRSGVQVTEFGEASSNRTILGWKHVDRKRLLDGDWDI